MNTGIKSSNEPKVKKLTIEEKKRECIKDAIAGLTRLAEVISEAREDLITTTDDDTQRAITGFALDLMNFVSDHENIKVCLNPACETEH